MTAACQADLGKKRVRRERDRAPPGRTHGSATTTPRVREAIQESDEKNTVLAKRHNVSRNTIAKWKARESTSDERMGQKNPRPKVLTLKDEAIILAYRWRTRLSLDDCLERLRRLMPQLSRSALHRCLERHGLGKIGRTNAPPPLTDDGPYRFEITANEVSIPDGIFGVVVEVFLAVEEVTKYVYAEVAQAVPENAAAFLLHLVAEFPQTIDAVATDIRPLFADPRATFDRDMAAVGPHPFAVACRANMIVHTRTPLPFQIPFNPKKRSRAVEIR
jgi:transposase